MSSRFGPQRQSGARQPSLAPARRGRRFAPARKHRESLCRKILRVCEVGYRPLRGLRLRRTQWNRCEIHVPPPPLSNAQQQPHRPRLRYVPDQFALEPRRNRPPRTRSTSARRGVPVARSRGEKVRESKLLGCARWPSGLWQSEPHQASRAISMSNRYDERTGE